MAQLLGVLVQLLDPRHNVVHMYIKEWCLHE